MIEVVRTAPVRTLIVDDTPLMRKAIRKILLKSGDIEVVGTAANGRECLDQVMTLNPDVVTLDVDMPVMNGITTLKNIMVRRQLPIVMISSLVQDGYFVFEALRLGVVDFLPKPERLSQEKLEREEEIIRTRVRMASSMQVQHVRRMRRQKNKRPMIARDEGEASPVRLVVVGANLAGPNTLMHIVTQLPPDFSGAIVALQEIHPRVLAPFCARFDAISPLPIIPVSESRTLQAGSIYMASSFRGVHVMKTPGENSYTLEAADKPDSRPIDRLFTTAAQCFGPNLCSVLLTGVGTDGAAGMLEIRKRGGLNLAQKQACCVYPNLVENAIIKGSVDAVLTPGEIADSLKAWAKSEDALQCARQC